MPELYLVTPRQFDPAAFSTTLATVLDAQEVACVRLDLDSTVEADFQAAVDALRPVVAAHDIPLVITDHYRLVEKLDLDGVHLSAAKDVRQARSTLAKTAIVGVACGTSRHAGMSAAEAGADYISFGPLTASALGSGEVADPDLFAWWAQMIEVPVVAEGGLDAAAAAQVEDTADFLAIGDEIWRAEDPALALTAILGSG